MNSFFALLFRQKYITRWGLMRSTTPETLSEHTAEVAAIAHSLAVIGNKVFGKSYNADKAAALALFHDVAEVYTGDMPTPIKYSCPEMKASYSLIEKEAVGRLITKLPKELRSEYSSLLLADEEHADEMRLVKTADKLCAYIKCITEEASGNREFSKAKKSIEAELDANESPELKYFRENFLEAFSLTLDEM